MVFCHKCGAEQTEDSEFCNKCGAKLISEENEKSQEKTIKNISKDMQEKVNHTDSHIQNESETAKKPFPVKIVALIAAGVIALAVVIVVVILNNNDSSYDFKLDKLYENTENGFSLKYPSDWSIVPNEGGDVIVRISDTGTLSYNAMMSVMKSTIGDSNPMEMSREELSDYLSSSINNFQLIEVNDGQVGGYPIKKIIFGSSSTNGEYEDVMKGLYCLYTNDGYQYFIQFRTLEENFEKFKPAFTAIVNSLKITKLSENIAEIETSDNNNENFPAETKPNSTENKTPVAYGQDFLGMTIGEIKKKYNVTIISLDSSYDQAQVCVSFATQDGTEWAYYPIISMTNDIDLDSLYVPDNTQPIGVYLEQGAYLDENIYVGMTYNQIKKNMGSALGEQEWDESNERYTATFAYTMSNGFISWIGNADGASASIEYYTRYVPEPEIDSPQTSVFSDSELARIRQLLGVPSDADVVLEIGTPYYWEGGDCQMCPVSVTYNGEELAYGEFAVGDVENCRSISPFPYMG